MLVSRLATLGMLQHIGVENNPGSVHFGNHGKGGGGMDTQLADVCEALQQNRFKSVCAEDGEVAQAKILDLIPKGSLVGVGDSVAVRQVKALEALEANGRIVIDPFSKILSELTTIGEITVERGGEIARMALDCEFFITGTNAVTEDGVLVNIDAYANRVAGMMFGPRML